ncbi:MAG: outer rane lipoproteinsorting protein [Sediminibacterium sp.]|nr:outer rane lipoproteinsorting protein [Sediminibacterium sp.]
MKKIIGCLFLMILAFSSQAQTAEEIVAKYEAAAGGREKLEAIKTLEVNSTLKMALMGQSIDLPLTLVREKGKLFRRQIGGIMGMGDSYTVITDTAGYVFIPAIRSFGEMQGTPASVTRIKSEELAAQQYEMDCAGAFAELVNYTAKGHTVELQGTQKVNKVICHKLKLNLKTGQSVIYFIDSQTFLVKQVEAFGEMAANLTGLGSMMKAFGREIKKDMKATMLIKEYQDVNGIKYPLKFSLTLGAVESEVENTTVRINEGVDEKWYRVGGK